MRRKAKLYEFVHIEKGNKVSEYTSSPGDGLSRYIQIDDLRNNNNIKFTSEKGVRVNEQDLIIAWDGANAGLVGYKLEGVIGSTLAKISINSDEVIPAYLGRFLQSKNELIKSQRTGTTIPHVHRQTLLNLEMTLPPLPEQQRIVKTLDTIQGLIDKRKETIRLLDDYIKAVFLDMFGETEQTATLGELLKSKESFKCGPFGSQLKIGEFVKEGIPVYGIDNVSINGFIDAKPKFITPEKFEELSAFSVSADDILITRTGTVGRSCLAPKKIPKAIIGPNLLKVRCNPSVILPEYLSFALNHDRSVIDQVLSMSPGATVAVYNTTNLKNLRIKIPEIKKQHEFLLKYGYVRKINMLFQMNDHLIKSFFNRVLSQSIT